MWAARRIRSTIGTANKVAETVSINPVVDTGAVRLRHSFEKGAAYGAAFARLGPMIGASKLGCSLYVVPAGKAPWPRHAHHSVEEMYFVLEGAGEFRLGEERYPVKAGDLVGAPAGTAEVAHQMVNTSDAELRYLAISTMDEPDVIEYPDSDKFRVVSRTRNGDPRTARILFHGRAADSLDYWDGEG